MIDLTNPQAEESFDERQVDVETIGDWTDDPVTAQALAPIAYDRRINNLVALERVILAKYLIDERYEMAKQYVRDAQTWKKKREEAYEKATGFLKSMLAEYMTTNNLQTATTPSGSVYWRRKEEMFIVGVREEELLQWCETLSPDLQKAFIKIEKSVNMPALKKAIKDGTLADFPFAVHYEKGENIIVQRSRVPKDEVV